MTRNEDLRDMPEDRVKLVVEGLELWRGQRAVLSGLSFEVSGGEALLVTGPNGTGKTTLMRALAGLIEPSAGRIRLSGVGEEREEDTPIGEFAHVVGHLNGIKSTLTVAENLAFARDYLGGSRVGAHGREADSIDVALARLGLDTLAAIPAGLLSAGQKRRLCLARLVVANRPVWLLDEPTVSLDAASTTLVTDMIEAHVDGGGIAIVVTHVPLGLVRSRTLELGRQPIDRASVPVW